MSMSTPGEEQPAQQSQRPHPWSLRIATISGIPLRLHITFLLFLVWIFVAGGRSWEMVLLVVLVFLCVVLHEFGHALVAQRFEVQTREITLYPIGGVAMLQGRPKPYQEFWIALAGPAVNVVIALALSGYLLATRHTLPNFQIGLDPNGTLVENLWRANVWLPLFNMIPAFPMDGGRVLRSLLAMVLPEVRATQIAAAVGQLLAFGLAFIGLFGPNILLLVIALFVFLGASQEVQTSTVFALVAGKKVADAMQTRFRTIESGASLEDAASLLLSGSQHDFPVVTGDQVLGLLSRTDIARGLASEGPTGYVAGHMNREFQRIKADAPLEVAFEAFAENEGTPILVMEEDHLLGMLTPENFSEFLMLESARTRRGPASR